LGTWETESAGSKSNYSIRMLRNNVLSQLVEKPNRARGEDKPSIFDLVITDDLELVQNIEDIGPLGKSDHSILNIVCGIQHYTTSVNDKLNYNKGNYEAFRQYINICWDNYFCNCKNDVDKMWNLFKSIIEVGINKFTLK